MVSIQSQLKLIAVELLISEKSAAMPFLPSTSEKEIVSEAIGESEAVISVI